MEAIFKPSKTNYCGGPNFFAMSKDTPWFAGQKILDHPQGLVICFHGAGADASMYTTKFIDRKSVDNSLIDLCSNHQFQLLCPILPGRSYNYKLSLQNHSVDTIVTTIINLISGFYSSKPGGANHEPIFKRLPFFVLGHSLGAILAFEFTRVIAKTYQVAPKALCLCASVPANAPKSVRPWKPVSGASDEELRLSMTDWDMKPEGLEPRMWAVFGKVVRADMELLDRYDGAANPDIPVKALCTEKMKLLLIRGTQDKMITREMMEGWKSCFPFTHDVQIKEVEGSHRLFYEADSRRLCYALFVHVIEQSVTQLPKEMSKQPEESLADDDEFGFGF
eukprot:Protomagalhaensia_wolfi_Nauph_80__4200@NODE_427_length_2539_cov_64_991600_g320_i0_p2_GENE_NODE_427_length_2539_cov_64_991600_g320_i0NODE_427_length_2539_cov_64_991600_g320_i0_p2_ORF_typecomplete_len335_score44_89Thioesterase/PF00975_20/1_1e15Abhydrolase_6/PF12697_7/6_1e10Hydrolase_4/PF12146_8/8_7e10Abhydrolase_5/PF12695_7/0_27Abhydrolase_5/PF12695_7/3_7DUF1057/PF06342_12/0_007DUF1057/PF06342_12/2e02Abhydrolase_1/PF00561_20/0_00096Abhydrolase_2/PF02230_16/14Abhydrolase_2/PF02230_16/1_2FSH1/PF0395